MKPYRDIADPRVAKALAHPLRTRILATLDGRTASPSELAAELDAPLGVLSYHVRRLTALGFVKLVRRVPRRGAVEHYYTATARPRVTNESWAAAPSVVKAATISSALEQVGASVNAAAAAGGFDAAEAHLTRSAVVVDDEGWRAMARELDAMTERLHQIEAESEARLRRRREGVAGPEADGDEEACDGRRHGSVVLMLFESATSVAEDDAVTGHADDDAAAGDADGGAGQQLPAARAGDGA
jgi:DNA-binding transcriptional ArsR family regulator